MILARVPRALALACLVLAGCKKEPASGDLVDTAPPIDSTKAAEPALALPVVGEAVIKGDLVSIVLATGQVVSEAIASTQSETSGTVEEVLVKPGDKVTKGQALAKLDTRLLDMEVKQARADLATANMNYTEALLDDSLNRIASNPARRERQRAQAGIDNRQVALDRALFNREKATVTAPYDGVIERVGVVVGDRIGAGKEIALIVDLMRLRVDARIMEHDIPALRLHGAADVTIGAVASTPVRGTIDAVLPLVDSVQKFGRASVRFKGNGIILPGMFASLRLEAKRISGQIIVPTSAIVEREGRVLVFVVHNGIAEWVYITPGPHNDRVTSVLPDSATGLIPLKAGDTVLVSGHHTLSHLAPVKLVATKADERR